MPQRSPFAGPAALPPLALAMLFQRVIANLNIVDPVTSNTDPQ